LQHLTQAMNDPLLHEFAVPDRYAARNSSVAVARARLFNSDILVNYPAGEKPARHAAETLLSGRLHPGIYAIVG